MVMPATGELIQLEPHEEQIVDGEPQLPSRPSSPLVHLEEKEKRTVPLPTGPRPPLPNAAQVAEQQAIQSIYGQPVLVWNRYTGSDKDWRELIRWAIPLGRTGDLHELALKSDNDAQTRWRIILGNVDQNVPTDRTLATPINWPWDRTILPGGTEVSVQVYSADGSAITVDGQISGSIR